MDPRIAWCPPEQVNSACYEQWSRQWDQQHSVTVNNMMNGTQQPEYIALDIDNQQQQYTPNNNPINKHFQNNHQYYTHSRKRDNKASTFGLNHSSCVEKLKNGGMTPWKTPDKEYDSPGVIGCVSGWRKEALVALDVEIIGTSDF